MITYAIIMEKYYCDICNYSTMDFYNFNRHAQTKKHLRNTSNESKEGYSKVHHRCTKKKGHLCPYCKKRLSTTGNLARHKRICNTKNNVIKHYELKIDTMNDKIKQLERHNKSLETAITTNGMTAKVAMSAINYLRKYHPHAPALVPIKDCKLIKNNSSNDIFVESIIDQQYYGLLHEYIGNFIVRIYKKEDVDEQSLWNSDTNRLTYIIMENMNKNKTVWQMDQRGHAVREYIIDPTIAYIKDCIDEYYKDHLVPDNNEIPYDMKLRRAMRCLNILQQIDNQLLNENILKYIAPKFYLNK